MANKSLDKFLFEIWSGRNEPKLSKYLSDTRSYLTFILILTSCFQFQSSVIEKIKWSVSSDRDQLVTSLLLFFKDKRCLEQVMMDYLF